MHPYITAFGKIIPSYGLLIVSGFLIANIIVFIQLKKMKTSPDDLILLEAYGIGGGFLGAKILYLLISGKTIDISRLTDPEYLGTIMNMGFVFYGGLLGGLAGVWIASRIHKIPLKFYLEKYIYTVPLVHGFGRIGCFLAGCCYGVPYDGVGAVVFLENSYAISGIPLFPVQLVEAVLLLILAGVILYLKEKKNFKYTIELYLMAYSILRFVLEFFRYDTYRGKFWILSTSQWISIMIFGIVVIWLFKSKKDDSGLLRGRV